jgi:hypothetical protein
LLEACEVLERAVVGCGWELLAFVVLSTHLHLLVKTPRANLAKGMQAFLSGHAQWSGRRRRRSGHLFQGRHCAEMIEDCTTARRARPGGDLRRRC